jgi:hypothetical protein
MADVYGALSDQLERLGKSALTIKAERDHLRIAIDLAVNLGLDYGTGDGAHHKMWVIDQMLRALLGDEYEQHIRDTCYGDEGPDTYEWDTGIAP